MSQEALQLAEMNRRTSPLAARVALLRGDLLRPSREASFDMIVANLPYVGEDELPVLEPEVRVFDPVVALVAPRDGLGLVERLVGSAPRHLTAGGWLLVEAAPRQAGTIASWLGAPPWGEHFVERDRFGRERIIGARLRDLRA